MSVLNPFAGMVGQLTAKVAQRAVRQPAKRPTKVAGFTVEQIAKRSGHSLKTVSRLIAGRMLPTRKQAIDISQATDGAVQFHELREPAKGYIKRTADNSYEVRCGHAYVGRFKTLSRAQVALEEHREKLKRI
jgi:DNA-binding transcriptional regulator YdaS (Cro superfamily)